MKTVHIMRGLPGSGKTYYAKNVILQDKPDFAYCSADNFFMVNGEYKYNSNLIKDAHNACYRDFSNAINSGINTVIVDNTNTEYWEFESYINYAVKNGYTVYVYHIDTPYEVCLSRQTHSVPEKTMKKMRDRWKSYHNEIAITEYHLYKKAE